MCVCAYAYIYIYTHTYSAHVSPAPKEWKELGKLIENDKKMKEFMRTKAPIAILLSLMISSPLLYMLQARPPLLLVHHYHYHYRYRYHYDYYYYHYYYQLRLVYHISVM